MTGNHEDLGRNSIDAVHEAQLQTGISEYQRIIIDEIRRICRSEGKEPFFYLQEGVVIGEVRRLTYQGALEALVPSHYVKDEYIHMEIPFAPSESKD